MTKERSTSKQTGQTGRGAKLYPIGVIQSILKSRSEAPKQGDEGAPDAWIVLHPSLAAAIKGLDVGSEIVVLTWFHKAKRDVLQVYPRSDRRRALTGVFATRSPDRPNPIGLHPVVIRKLEKDRILVGPIEALDGTPVVDIKPLLTCKADFKR